MELNNQINTFTKGLDMDTDVTMIPEGKYRYAENIRIITDAEGTTGLLQNIEHIRQYIGGIDSTETILGTAVTSMYDEDSNKPKECGIVLTKSIKDNKIYNKLYKVTGFESTKLISEVITEGRLGISDNVSIVTNYESDEANNVYICDGNTPIKVINIYDSGLRDENGVIVVTDSSKFDITPGCVLLPFRFVNTITGSLPAGSIQYCYQLFNLHGPETTTSALSEVIPITKYDTYGDSSKIKGQIKGELSGRGCQIKARFKNDGRFDRARIFSIVYLDNISIPDIYIINEIEVPSKNNEFVEFTYNDNGSSFLSKITIDEFNALVPFEFNAKSIEKMGNRLYASNIQEMTWDPEFDARAYRCDSSGSIVLDSSDLSQTIVGTLNSNGTITASTGNVVNGMVPKEHDCINPSNVAILEPIQYQYGYDSTGSRVRGGTGPNVSYKFIYTELVNSDDNTTYGTPSSNLTISNNTPVTKIYTYYETGDNARTNIFNNGQSFSSTGKKIIPNYSDPYVCANYLGYQRDEIYRFGIIFYNKKNIPSPVHWIGDIRMPSPIDAGTTVSRLYPFHLGNTTRCYGSEYKEMVSYALGIEFTIKNLPSDALSYEIVRCDRNERDRTIVSQGILSALFKFDDWGEKKYWMGSNDMRPAPMFNIASNFKTTIERTEGARLNSTHESVPGYFEFVSPEICISKDSMLQSIQNNSLCMLYKVDSLMPLSAGEGIANRITIPQGNYTDDPSEEKSIYNPDMEGLEKNDRRFGYPLWMPYEGSMFFDAGYGENNNHDLEWYGYAGVFKYYQTNLDNSLQNTTLTIEDAIVSNILPYQVSLENTKNYVQFINNKSYINTSIGGCRQFGNHGINAVLKVDDSFDPYMDVEQQNWSCFSTAIIANIKQNAIPYGGNTYISRQNSVYNSCGCFSEVENNTAYCYGGDTYLGILDYLNTSVSQQESDTKEQRENRLCCVSYIPLESQVNLNLRSDDSYHRTLNGRIGQNLIQNEPTVLPNGWVQKTPYYEYNPVYSATSGSKQYVPKGIYAVDNQKNQTRIVVSELKTNNELTDSWTKFKFANYIDVDSKYGQITNLKTFNNKLFYWQDNAVGVAAVNERSLITDNNMAELTLGTSGVLARFDYVATLNGSSIVNDKSIVTSATTIYWYDFDKNEICALGNGMVPLSKTKSVQSYLNSLSKSHKDNVVSFYDKKYNEVWFRVYDKALIYNEQLQVFTSFYTHDPNWFFPFSDKLVTIKNNNMYYLHNIYDIPTESQEARTAKIEFVVNKDISNTKVFDNVAFSADLKDENNINKPHVITDVQFKTKTQQTDLEGYDDEPHPAYDSIEVREDNYRFAIPREKVSDEALNELASQSYLGRMRGKYLICDYTFDCNSNREFKLPYIKTTYRYSML